MTTPDPTTRAPECPRCGYDLRGVVETWGKPGLPEPGASCPLRGTCSECGLEFEWRYIFTELLAAQAWFFETARRRLLWTLCATWLAALRPWIFWKQVRLELRPRLRRLALMVVVPGAVFLLVSLVAVTLMRALWYWTNMKVVAAYTVKRYPTPWGELDLAMRDIWQETLFNAREIAYIPLMPMAIAMVCMPPVVLMCLPWTRARSKVRPAHIARAAVYALAPGAVIVAISMTIGALLLVYGQTQGPWWRDPWFAKLDPLRPREWTGGFVMPYHWVALVWGLVYWWCVLTHGWRMDDRRQVYLALMVPSLLLTLLLMVMQPGALLMMV